MRLEEMKIGQECYRAHWRDSLTIVRKSESSWSYYENGQPAGTVASSMASITDYKLKEQKMKAQDIKVLVITTRAQNNGQSIQSFSTEEEALEYIADFIECEAKAKFTMFKPYQKVENKRLDIKKLITKL